MNFRIATAKVSIFEDTIKTICNKFKLEVSFSYSEKIKLYQDDNGYDIFGFNAEVIIPQIEKMTETGFSYLGCIKNEEVITIHPSANAEAKDFSLSSLKSEIENFPCQECGKKITRKIIHVFENIATGEISVYGSGCAIKKFGFDLTKLAYKFEYIMNAIGDGDYDRMGGSGYEVIDADYWSAVAYRNIIKIGYVSGSKAKYDESLTSTKQETWDIFNILTIHIKNPTKYEIMVRNTVPAELTANAFDFDAFRDYVKSYVDSLEEGDFSFNMLAVAGLLEDKIISPRLSGFNAYLVFKFWFDTVRIPVEKMSFNEDYSGLNVGDKLKGIKVRVLGYHSFEGFYGITYIYNMVGVDNNIKYKWFSSKALEINHEYIITSCSVKELENHVKYGKSVVITRARTKEV